MFAFLKQNKQKSADDKLLAIDYLIAATKLYGDISKENGQDAAKLARAQVIYLDQVGNAITLGNLYKPKQRPKIVGKLVKSGIWFLISMGGMYFIHTKIDVTKLTHDIIQKSMESHQQLLDMQQN